MTERIHAHAVANAGYISWMPAHRCCEAPDVPDTGRGVTMVHNHSSPESDAEKIACRDDCCCGSREQPGEPGPAATCGCCPGDEPASAEPLCDCGSGDDPHWRAGPGPAALTETFTVDGLDCADCAATLEKSIGRLNGVIDVDVNFAAAMMRVTYDRAQIRPEEIERAVGGFGYRAALVSARDRPEVRRSVFRLSGLDCADCAAGLERRVGALPGVYSVQVNFAAGTMTVEHTAPAAEILKTVEQGGYKAEREEAGRHRPEVTSAWWTHRRTQATIVSGIILAAAGALDLLGLGDPIVIPLYAAAAIVGGYSTAKRGLYGLRSLTFDMNLLMTVAVIGAAAIGEWGEGATVAFLFSLGNALQTYTMDRTRQSIRTLMDLAPPDALVRRNGVEQRLPVEEVAVGDLIIVRPGERIAMDGTVRSGASAVNQATITGESLPVEKAAGDTVYAGTVNEHGALEIEVTRVAADSTLAKIMHLVEEAQAQKAPSQQFVDLFARYYTPAVLLAAAGTMVVPWLLFGQDFATWFYTGLVLLVISCPCALVISTPVSIVSAIGNASHSGVLIKGGAYLEQMGTIQAVAFDKTGTLTHGRPVVTDILPLGGRTERDLLAVAAAVEKRSEHPLAVAVVERAGDLPLPPATNFKALVGRGARADVGGQTVYVGNLRLFDELGLNPAQYEATVTGFEEEGKTVMLVGSGGAISGMIAVADTLRGSGRDAVSALRRAGMKQIAMLTGDNRRVAGFIGKSLGLDACYSDLLPQEKVAAVQEMTRKFGPVVMVGDGVNDAPALAAASVGVAMGVAGSDTALETADIALMSDDLGKLAYVIDLSRRTVAVVKQNIGFAILVKLVFVALTFLGFVDLWLAVLADTGSSLLVTVNGMRLMQKTG